MSCLKWTSRQVTEPSRTQVSRACKARKDRTREAHGGSARYPPAFILTLSLPLYGLPTQTLLRLRLGSIFFQPSLDLRWMGIKHLAISLVRWWYRIFFTERPGAHCTFHLFTRSLRRVSFFSVFTANKLLSISCFAFSISQYRFVGEGVGLILFITLIKNC